MIARGPIKFTCPIIDDCIRYIERALVDPEEVACLADLVGGRGILEDVRSANITLREWGAEQEDLAISQEAELIDMRKELDRANDEIRSLREQIESLEAA